jgi:anti-sigma B factor antagonist
MKSSHSFLEDKLMVITLQGDIIGEENGAEILELAQKVKSKGGALILNLEGVRYINSSGIGVLVTLYTQFEKADTPFILVKPSDHVMKLLTIIKLQDTFTIVNSNEEAIQKIKA